MESDTKDLKEKIEKAGLQTPNLLTLMITEACNLSCPHCLLNCRSLDTDPVPKKNILNIINEFSELGGETLLVTGGEPLSHSDWFDILGHACNSTELNDVGLQTNGAVVTPEDVEKLKSLPVDKFTIQVSIDGATPETNDLIRGKGNFKASIRALKLFVEAGMGERIKVAFTEMKHNFHEIPEMLKLVNELGIGKFVSGVLVKGGRAKNIEWIDLPDRSQVRDLVKLYESDQAFRTLYDKLGNVSAIEWLKGRSIPTGHVCNCISTPFISAEGKMYPCVMYLNDELAVDNIHEIGLIKGIIKGLEKWRSLPEFDKKRSDSLEKCQDCRGKDHCRGGCLGRAQVADGNPMSVEDRCELRREVYYFKKDEY